MKELRYKFEVITLEEFNPEKFIQEEIYNTFHIGEHWLGKDIKEELERIYKKL